MGRSSLCTSSLCITCLPASQRRSQPLAATEGKLNDCSGPGSDFRGGAGLRQLQMQLRRAAFGRQKTAAHQTLQRLPNGQAASLLLLLLLLQ